MMEGWRHRDGPVASAVTSGSRGEGITARNRPKSTGTARSAILAGWAAFDPAAPKRRENRPDWRESSSSSPIRVRSILHRERAVGQGTRHAGSQVGPPCYETSATPTRPCQLTTRHDDGTHLSPRQLRTCHIYPCRLTDESALLESRPFGPHVSGLETVLPTSTRSTDMLGMGKGTQTGRAATTGRFVFRDGGSVSSADYGGRVNRAEEVGCPTDVGAERRVGSAILMAIVREDMPPPAPSWSRWTPGTAGSSAR